MPYPRFLVFSLLGGTMWIAFMMTLGFQLGQVPMVRRNFEKAVLGIVFVSLLPMFSEVYKAWRARAARGAGMTGW
jgi:membrane-associated protein